MLIFLLFVGLVIATDPPSVETQYGTIQGFRVNTEPAGGADIFLGIPFAKPPLGELRFEKPVLPTPWTSPLNATTWSKECVPHTSRAIINEVDEDCLTINVIRPTKQPPKDGFPVLVWIHGGGFQFGSARRHGYQGFADAYATRDVIVVSIQYRLGVLGYLSTGTQELPGNLGNWDMTLALKFINETIGAFGGNPKQMTLWGLSAGAAAVGQLLVSPHSRDYAVGGIELSGSAWSSWSLGHSVVDHSLELIKELGCAENTKECLKTKTIQEFDDAVEKVGYATNNLLIAKWGPRIDGDFFPADPSELTKEAPPKPVIAGVGDKDFSFFTVMKRSTVIHNLSIENAWEFDESNCLSRVEQLMKDSTDYGLNNDVVLEHVLEHYLNGRKDVLKDNAFYVNQYNNFAADVTFHLPLVESTEERQLAGWPVYLYSFDHYNEEIWKEIDAPKGVWGSVHVNEFTYLYDHKALGHFEYNKADILIKENLRDTMVNFAKTGKAAWSNSQWPVAGKNLDYLSIKETPELKSGYFKEMTDFWRAQKKYGYDIMHLKKVSIHDEL